MFIQTSNQNLHLTLPEFHWISPVLKAALTPENAEDYGYVEVQKYYTQQVQAHLDAKAQSRGYDNVVSACSYAAAPNNFQAESIAFITWRSAVWACLYQGFADVLAGNRTLPSVVELLAELPSLESIEAAA